MVSAGHLRADPPWIQKDDYKKNKIKLKKKKTHLLLNAMWCLATEKGYKQKKW